MGRGLGWVTHRGPCQPRPFCVCVCDQIPRQQEREAGSCPAFALQRRGIRIGGEDAPIPGTRYHPLLRAHAAPASPRARLGAAITITIRHCPCRPGGVSPSQRRRKERGVCTGLASASAPQPPKPPQAPRPASSGQGENSPAPDSSAVKTATRWRAFV